MERFMFSAVGVVVARFVRQHQFSVLSGAVFEVFWRHILEPSVMFCPLWFCSAGISCLF